MERTTSSRILDFLQSHPPASAAELARSLSLTSGDIRYHLGILMKTGALSRTIKHTHPRGGRPGYYYSCVTGGPASANRLLLEAMLYAAGELASDTASMYYQKSIEYVTAGFHGEPGNSTLALQQVVAYLISLGYQAGWEARIPRPVILLRNCPYHETAERFPSVCAFDAQLISALTRTPCNLLQSIRSDPRHVRACLLQLSI